jgi:hypothetical protein
MKNYEQIAAHDPSGRSYRRIGVALQWKGWLRKFSAAIHSHEIFFGVVNEQISFPTLSRRVDQNAEAANDNLSTNTAAE